MTNYPTPFQYQRQLDRVVDYIYEHLEEDVRIDTLAEVACLSPYHWHRIYTAMRGETVAATVKRLRLQRAADRLANSDMPIAEVAKRADYNTVEAFNRAFKAVYELPPAKYRANGSHAAYKAAMRSGDANQFDVKIHEMPETRCVAVAHTGSYMQIDQAMGKLFAQLQQHNLLTQDTAMMALFVDDPDLVDTEELRSFACSPVSTEISIPDELSIQTIAAGPVATLRYKGPYADMHNAYRWLYGVWLPASGNEPADAPAIEAYLNNPQEVAPTELLTDISLPLRSA